MPLICTLMFAHSVGVPPATPHIGGGDVVDPCAFPATVATVIDSQGSWGTGSLVHQRVVLYSAHSGIDFDHVFLGDHISGEGRQLAIERCVAHPDWDGQIEQGDDIAYCLLVEAVTDVVPVPIMMGCEVDQALVVGASVVQSGFGMSIPNTPPDGAKRWLATGELSTGPGPEIGVVNPGGGQPMIGDSGGPPLVQLDDGSWRMFGVLSHGTDLESWYVAAHPHVPWLEMELSAEGIDLTPCHDADGTWNPTEGCGGFPLDPSMGGGSWSGGCDPASVSGLSSTCGPPFTDDGGTGDTGDTSGGPSDTTGSADETGSEGTGSGGQASSGGAGSEEPSTGLSPTAGSSSDSGTSSGEPAGSGDDAGCSCTASPNSGPTHVAVLLLAALGWRRRRAFAGRSGRVRSGSTGGR